MSIVFSIGCIVIGQFLLRYHSIRPQDSAEETVSPLPARFSCAPSSIVSSGRVPTGPTRFTLRFGDVGDTVQPSLFPPALGVSPVPCCGSSWVTDVGPVSLMSFFVAFIFLALVDSEGRWQRYPTAAVMAFFVVLLVLCVWRTWEGRSGFAVRLPRFRERSTMLDDGVSPIEPKGPANMV